MHLVINERSLVYIVHLVSPFEHLNVSLPQKPRNHPDSQHYHAIRLESRIGEGDQAS